MTNDCKIYDRIKKVFQAGSQVEVGTGMTAAFFLGLILVGGYSHGALTQSKSLRAMPLTFGITAQIEGLVYQLNSDPFSKIPLSVPRVSKVNVAQAVLVGDRFWVEENSKFSVVTGRGSAFSVLGPSVVTVESQSEIRSLNGTFRLIGDVLLQTPFETTQTDGECVAWLARDSVQVLAVRKSTKVWNSHVKSAVTELLPGWYTEASMKFRFLTPRRALMVDTERGSALLAKFGVLWNPEVAQEVVALRLQNNTSVEVESSNSHLQANINSHVEDSSLYSEPNDAHAVGSNEVYSALEVASREPKKEVPTSDERRKPKRGIASDEEKRTFLESIEGDLPRF